MKLKTRTTRPIRLARPRVKLTETEILADLNYPAPAMADEKTFVRERAESSSR